MKAYTFTFKDIRESPRSWVVVSVTWRPKLGWLDKGVRVIVRVGGPGVDQRPRTRVF